MKNPLFLQFCGKDKSVRRFPGPLWLADLLDTLNVDKHILFVDGIKHTEEHLQAVCTCFTWAVGGIKK